MKRFICILSVCCWLCSIWAIPARKGRVLKSQPDGSQVSVYQHGDAYFRWMTNESGEWIQQDENGFYHAVEALSEEAIEAKRMARIAPKNNVAVPLNIAPRGLVILVSFSDVAFSTSRADMDSMLVGEDYTRDYSYVDNDGDSVHVTSKGSARSYFEQASSGQYKPEFDVVGPVTVSKNMEYYGKNVANFDANPWVMVKEACELVDDSVDFTQYDNDNDGKVDFVYVIYAGYGEADGAEENTIWPHSYQLSDAGVYCKVDEKRVDQYACGNELDLVTNQYTGIGPFCHEFSHVLGLPDLYVTNNAGHKTLDEWSIMDYGPYSNDCNTPPTFSAYERFFMGWLTPRVMCEKEKVALLELQTSNTALLICETDEHNLVGNNPNPTTFHLLENRQRVGWDTYLPGHGLMLTKVQYSSKKWTENTVNNVASKMGVDLIEADGDANEIYAKETDLFPAGATEYKGIENHWIENIVEADSIIYFDYKADETGIENHVKIEECVMAIYNILGQKLATTEIDMLPSGTYVVLTSLGVNKIIRR